MGGVPRKMLEYINDDVEYLEHQASGVRRMAAMTSGINGDDMGLGKTLQALTVAAIGFEMKQMDRFLVVAPATLKENWADELDKFTSFGYHVLDGTPKQRAKQIETFDAHCLIVNYEQVIPHLADFNRMGFGMVIYDEAHYIKGHKSQRTKACHKLNPPRHWLLTGSPILNQVDDLWALLHRVNKSRFPDYYRFVNRYAVYGGYKDKQIIGVKNEAELKELVAQYMIRRTKKEVLDLPGKEEPQKIMITMLPEQEKLYKQAVEELKVDTVGGSPLEIENAMVKLLRLKQICGTTAAIPGHEDHSAKLDKAVEMCQELIAQGEPVVVFTQFRSVLGAFTDRLAKANIPVRQLHGDIKKPDRKPIVNAWSAEADKGNAEVLACMIQVAGIGLTMTASRTVIFLDRLFTPKLNEQAEDRLDRIGQTRKVRVYDLQMRNSVEQRIEKINRNKEKLFGTVIGAGDTAWKRKLLQLVLEDDEEDIAA